MRKIFTARSVKFDKLGVKDTFLILVFSYHRYVKVTLANKKHLITLTKLFLHMLQAWTQIDFNLPSHCHVGSLHWLLLYNQGSTHFDVRKYQQPLHTVQKRLFFFFKCSIKSFDVGKWKRFNWRFQRNVMKMIILNTVNK